MKKIYFSFLMLAMLMVSTVAKAQYTVTVTSDPENNYYSGDQGFDPAAVAEALGLADAAAVQTLIDAGDNVYIKLADETKSNSYTGNTNEFWMNADGVPQGYGDNGTCWYVGLSYDVGQTDEETGVTSPDVVDVYMGQMPNFFKEIYTDSELKCTLYLVNGDKEVSFDVTLNVNAAPEPTLPTPTTQLSGLEIVANYELPLNFTTGKEYEGKTYSATLEGIYDALGVTSEELDEVVSDYTYTQMVTGDTVYAEDGSVASIEYNDWLDELVRPEDVSGGAWFGRYINIDEATDTETIFGNAPKNWGTGSNTFYTQNITLADGEFSIVSGQFPGVLKAGDSDYANLYIIVGSKAACVKVYTNVTDPEVINPDELTMVGETTIAITSPANDDYSTKSFIVDMEAVTTALGCTIDDIEDFYAWASETDLSDNHTTSGGGYYFNENGYIDTWANKAPVYIDPSNLAEGKFGIGQYAGIYSDITEDVLFKTQIVFQYGSNYYAVNIEYTITPKSQVEVEFNLVSTEALSIQIVPSSETYAWETTSTLDLDYIEGKIGTTDFTLYTDKANDEGVLEWSKSYTCTPNPGFWYGITTYENEAHQVVVDNAGYGTNSFGLTYADGEIIWYQYPGQRAVDDKYEANIYLVNEETGDYIKYILYVSYVEEVKPEGEIVGTEDVVVEMSDEIVSEDGYYNAYIDMSKAFEALGIEDPSLIESCSVLAAKSATMFSEVGIDEEIVYSKNGYVVDNIDEINLLTVAVKLDDANIPYLQINDNDGLFDDPKAEAYVRIGLEYDGKRYIHNIWLIGSEIATGISATPAQTYAPAAIYSIAGAKLNAMQKGLNIVRMQDGSVKKLFVK